jgi:hypothetical protein
MKSTTFILGLLFTTSLLAQEQSNYQQTVSYTNTGEVILREVMPFPGKSKEELYQLVEEWFARKFDGASSQFVSDSENQSKLIGQGFTYYQMFIMLNGTLTEVSYTLTISIKEERIKVEMEEILILGETSLVTLDVEYLHPKPAHEVIGDKALYKRNGKARSVKKKHKEKILNYWFSLLNSVDDFINTSQEEEEW